MVNLLHILKVSKKCEKYKVCVTNLNTVANCYCFQGGYGRYMCYSWYCQVLITMYKGVDILCTRNQIFSLLAREENWGWRFNFWTKYKIYYLTGQQTREWLDYKVTMIKLLPHFEYFLWLRGKGALYKCEVRERFNYILIWSVSQYRQVTKKRHQVSVELLDNNRKYCLNVDIWITMIK